MPLGSASMPLGSASIPPQHTPGSLITLDSCAQAAALAFLLRGPFRIVPIALSCCCPCGLTLREERRVGLVEYFTKGHTKVSMC